MTHIEHILKIMADRNRLRILYLLRQKVLCVCELAYVLKISQPSVSRHLKKLKDAGTIREIQNGLWTDYAIVNDQAVFSVLWRCVLPVLDKDTRFDADLKTLKKADRKRLCCEK